MVRNNQPGILCIELLLLQENEEYGVGGAKFFAPYVSAYSKSVYELHDLINEIGSYNHNKSMIFKASIYETSNIHDANMGCYMAQKGAEHILDSGLFNLHTKTQALTIEDIKLMADMFLNINNEYGAETHSMFIIEGRLEELFSTF